MAIDDKLSPLVEQWFPDFVRTEGPKFVTFIKAFYEWMEETNKITDATRNLLSYRDIDRTLDSYIDYFQNELLHNIPKNIVTDKRLLAKYIKKFYRSRGSEQSYRLLFRILYNEDIDFYYPGEDILRASDGKWTIEKSIKIVIEGNPANLFDFLYTSITGTTSGATARVERIIQYTIGGQTISEFFLSSISGTFVASELITSTEVSISPLILGVLSSVDIDPGDSGRNHQVGDTIDILSSLQGQGANGTITSVSNDTVEFAVSDAGSGYVANTISITIEAAKGSDAAFTTNLGNCFELALDEDPIFALKDVPLDTGATFVSTGANSTSVSANLAAANISSTFASALTYTLANVCSIPSVNTTNRGSGYISGPPTVTVTDTLISSWSFPDGTGGILGNNAVVIANNIVGVINAVSIVNPGINYANGETVTINNLTRSATNATGTAIFSGLYTYPGRYVGNDGFLSDTKYLQDNFYYQEFSYVLKTGQYINRYRDIINKLLHPAGTALFGEVSIETIGDVSYSANGYSHKYTKAIGTIQISGSTSMIGIGTNFNTILSNNASIMIKAGANEGLYKIDTVFSDTSASLKYSYRTSTLGSGTLYYANTVI